MQLEASRSCTLICGKSGTGKTTFALRYLVADSNLQARFIFDPDGEAAPRLGLAAAESAEELGANDEEVAHLANGSFLAINVDSGCELRGRVF